MSVRRRVMAALVGVLSVRAADAQDVEMMSQAMHHPLPTAYYERLRRNPRAFQWPDIWRPGGASLTPGVAASAIPPRSGILSILVIPTLFADSPSPVITPKQLQQSLFDGPATYGTITAAYDEMSGGKLQIRGTVVPWVRSSLTLAQALGSEQGFGEDARLGEWVRDGLVGADALVDFGLFDNNGADGVPNSGDDNGIVDAVVFLYEERSQPCGGTGPWPQLTGYGAWFPENTWPSHAARKNGGQIAVSGFIMTSATDCSGVGILPPSILTHELGHVMGLPDLYDATAGLDPASRRWVVGCWDLMSAGAWGCGDGAAPARANRPTHMGAWSKAALGWSNETVTGAVRNQEFLLHAANRSNEALRVVVSPTESFLIEYRERDGFDVELAASGVLMWHVDQNAINGQCTACPPPYQVMLEEADGNQALLKLSVEGGNRGEAGDVFGPVQRRFSAATIPAATLHNGTATTLTIHSIIVDPAAHVAHVRLTTEGVPILAAGPLAPWSALTEDQRVLHVTGGAEPYTVTVSGALPRGLSLVAVADDVLVRGTPVQAGIFTPTLTVNEALGQHTALAISLTVTAPVFTLEHLLEPLLDRPSPSLPAVETEYLDQLGNRNARFDIGDFRAYVLAQKP